jgi:hypothetical protein
VKKASVLLVVLIVCLGSGRQSRIEDSHTYELYKASFGKAVVFYGDAGLAGSPSKDAVQDWVDGEVASLRNRIPLDLRKEWGLDLAVKIQASTPRSFLVKLTYSDVVTVKATKMQCIAPLYSAEVYGVAKSSAVSSEVKRAVKSLMDDFGKALKSGNSH